MGHLATFGLHVDEMLMCIAGMMEKAASSEDFQQGAAGRRNMVTIVDDTDQPEQRNKGCCG